MTDQSLTQERSNAECHANGSSPQTSHCKVRPLADAVETTDSVVLFVELPGVLSENLDVAVENGVVDVSATSVRTLPEGFQVLGGAEQTRRYFRQFKLAETLDSTQMQAEFKNGLLKLVVPKKPENRRQKIAITASA